MKKLIILAMVALMGVTANAQIVSSRSRQVTRTSEVAEKDEYRNGWNGLRFNFGYTNSAYDYESGSCDNFDGFRFGMGYSAGICFNENVPIVLEIAPEISADIHEREWTSISYHYNYNGHYSYSYSNESENYVNLAVNVPVNIGYNVRFGESSCSIYPYTGFNVKINALTLEGDDTYDDLDYEGNLVQLDWQIGAQLRLSKFVLGLQYRTNLIPVADNDYWKMSQSGVNLSIGFNF